MGATLVRLAAGDGWTQGRVGNVVLLDHATQVPRESVDGAFESVTQGIALHRQGIVLIAIFGERTRVPSLELRRTIADFLAARKEQLLLGCTVIEGDSMSATVKFAATAMMMTLVKPPYGHKTLRTLGAACAVAASRALDDSGAPLSQPALFAAATALRPVDAWERRERSRW